MNPFSRVLYALLLALLALPLASCDSVTGKTDTPSGGGGGDPIITPPASSAQLHASIASVSQHVAPGGGLTVTVVVSNLGPGTAKGATAAVSLPGGLMNQFYAPEGTACGVEADDVCGSSEQIDWNVGDLAEGESRTLGFKISVYEYTNEVAGSIGVSANASGARSASASIPVTVSASLPVKLALAVSDGTARPGDEVTAIASYVAWTPTSSAQLRVAIPSGMEFVSASGGGAASGSTVAWTLGALAARQGGQQTVRLRVATGHKPGQTIVISGSLTNGSGSTALGQALVAVQKSSGGLRVSVTSTPTIVGHGSAPTFTVSVTNEGNVAVQSARLTAGVPQMAENFNAPSGTICGRSSPGICGAGEQIDWNIGVIQPGEGRSFTFAPVPYTYAGYPYLYSVSAGVRASSGSTSVGSSAVVVR